MKVHIYRNYRFIDKDPIIDAIRTVVKDEELSNGRVASISGVAASTLDNWFEGGTRKPQNATVTQVAAALGYVRRDTLDRRGMAVVGYAKASGTKLDYEEEIKKQADWLLKHKRKRNGKAGA